MNHLHRLVAVASAAFFIAGSALAQNPGTVTNHGFLIGKGAGTSGYTSLLCGSAQLAVGQSAADPICKTVSGDVTINSAGVTAIGASKVTNSMLVDSSISVKDPAYGALGNSNGTHGNGHDDTAGIQAAFNAGANGTIHIPCGTYRITSTINITDRNPRRIVGEGTCTRIYADFAAAGYTWDFNFATSTSACNDNPCADIENIVFIAPYIHTSGQAAIHFNNINNSILTNNQFQMQWVGLQLSNSYTGAITSNSFNNIDAAGIYSVDASGQNYNFVSNSFTACGLTSSSAAIVLGGGVTYGTVPQVLFNGNEFLGGYIGIQSTGMESVNVIGNYFENNVIAPIVWITTASLNNGWNIEGNHLQKYTAASDPMTWTIDNVTGVNFAFNDIDFFTIAFGANAKLVTAKYNYLWHSTITGPTVGSCTGLGASGTCALATGSTDQAGAIVLTVAGAAPAVTGNFTLTFSNPIGANGSVCTYTAAEGTGNWATPQIFTTTAIAVGSQSTSWINGGGAALPVATYNVQYMCAGR